MNPFDIPLSRLRARRSAKWTIYPPDLLPLPVAEMDVDVAPAITRVLRSAVDASDTGYAGRPDELIAAFQGFTQRRWSWDTTTAGVRTCADVATGATELLRLLVRPGDRVIITPPVYPPFYAWIAAAKGVVEETPLLRDAQGQQRLDVEGIEAAFHRGAKVLLLCHPHNPMGALLPTEDLRAVAQSAASYGRRIISDEIHAPLTMPNQRFVPFLSVSEEAAATGIALHSPSKGWNLAGLKCALIVTAGERLMPAGFPHELPWGVGNFGQLAAEAAYKDGEQWLDDVVASLSENASFVATTVRSIAPQVRFEPPQSSYLAWLDFSDLGLTPTPAEFFRATTKVALNEGADFGTNGEGHIRLNYACSKSLLSTVLDRMGAALANRQS